MLIAWGATGNERNSNEGSVLIVKLILCLCHDQNLLLFFLAKIVRRRCISLLLKTTQARASCYVRWTASIRTRSTTKARQRLTEPWRGQCSTLCVFCSIWTLTRARCTSRPTRTSNSCDCWKNNASDQLNNTYLFEKKFFVNSVWICFVLFSGNWTNFNSQSSSRRTASENSKIL